MQNTDFYAKPVGLLNSHYSHLS